MNLLNHFESLLTKRQTGIATITGHKGGTAWVGKTIGEAVVMLNSKDSHATGQKVYYDRLTGEVLGAAPDGVWAEFGV